MKPLPRGSVYGLLLVAGLALLVTALAQLPACRQLSLSPMILGVVLGMILANTIRHRIPDDWSGGLQIAGKQILRAGIVFYGFRLTLSLVFLVGKEAILIDSLIVLGTFILGNFLGRLLGLDQDERLLISSGSAICGAAAVLATEPVVEAKPHKTVVAVATVVLFGTLSMFAYPLLYRSGLLEALSPRGVGIYTGATVHEVAHVVGAGAAMGPEIAATATITKMIRVILLAPTLLALSYLLGRGRRGSGDKGTKKIQVPWFAFYFVGVVLLNSLLFTLAEGSALENLYREVTGLIEKLDTFALTMAMTAIGMDATLAKFRQSGAKAFLLASGLYIWLVFGGYLLTLLLV